MWGYIAVFVVAMVLAYALAPRPESKPPPGIEDIQAPIAEEGAEIPVLFGCRDLRGANVTWYGDYKTIRIRSSGGKK